MFLINDLIEKLIYTLIDILNMNLKADLITKQYVKDVTERCCKVMNIKTPTIIFNRNQYKKYFNVARMSKDMTKFRLLGKAQRNTNLIFINIKGHRSIRELNDTIIHECFHLKDWNCRHGKEFNNNVKFYLNCLFDYGTQDKKVY